MYLSQGYWLTLSCLGCYGIIYIKKHISASSSGDNTQQYLAENVAVMTLYTTHVVVCKALFVAAVGLLSVGTVKDDFA